MSNDPLIFLHKALQEDQQVSRLVAIRNSDGNCLFLVMAQGNSMIIIDPKTYKITEKYPFMLPIVGLEAIENDSPSVFVLLRNLDWYIFQLPELIAAGSFIVPHMVKDRRFFLPVDNYSELGSTCQNPISTAAIHVMESRIPIAVHPQYIAVHIIHNLIHVIPIKQPNNIILIKINFPNVVDIAFLGPVNYSTRLAILCDPEFNRKDYGDEKATKKRVFAVYSLQRGTTEFKQEFILDVKPDSHTILPLSTARESSAVVFTLDGVIRITAPEGLTQTVEHITLFLEGLVLLCEHYSDDIYFLEDSSGGLCVALLPPDGRPSSLKLLYTGPASSVVTIDKNRFAVASAFGDCTFYYAEFGDNVRQIETISTLEATGTVRSLTILPGGDVRMLTGRGCVTQMKTFHMSIECERQCLFDAPGCIDLFSCPYNDNALLCLSFLENSFICETDGSKFTPVDRFITNEPTILFSGCGNGFIAQVTPSTMNIFKNDKIVLTEKSEDGEFVCAAACENRVICCTSNSIARIYEASGDNFKKVRKIHANGKILFSSISDNHIALLTESQDLIVFNKQEKMPITLHPLDIDKEAPVNLVIRDAQDSFEVYVGTFDGHLIKITLDGKVSEKVGDSLVKLVPSQKGIYGATSPAFLLSGGMMTSLDCGDCNCIAVSKEYVFTLDGVSLSVFKSSGGRRGCSKLDFKAADAIDARFFSPSKCVILEDNVDKATAIAKECLTLYKDGRKALSLPPETGRVSLFDLVELNGKKFIILGLDNCSLKLFDDALNEACQPQRVKGIPTAAAVCNGLLCVAEGKQISVYSPQFLHTTIELDPVSLTTGHVLATTMRAHGDLLIVGDAVMSVSAYRITDEGIQKVGGDSQAKGICRLCLYKNYVFASTYDSCLYAFELTERGDVNEIGGIQTDSVVSAIKSDSRGLIYGTDHGGVYRIDEGGPNFLLSLRDIFNAEKINFSAKRVIENAVRFDVPDPFVDLDNIAILGRLSQNKFDVMLDKAGCTKEQYFNAISEI